MKELQNIHGTSIALEENGVLIVGFSGSGKSDLALRLIDSGATLICDDQTICKKVENEIFLFAQEKICGLIEVRGLGLIKVPYVENIKLKMIVKLKEGVDERFPLKNLKKKIFGIAIPMIEISAKQISAEAKVKLMLYEINHNG